MLVEKLWVVKAQKSREEARCFNTARRNGQRDMDLPVVPARNL